MAKLLPQPLDLVFKIPGLGLVVAVVALTLLGWLAAGYAGRGLLRLSDMIMAHMPVVSGIYCALKQMFETVLANRSNSFREVVMVEWPRPGMWTVAFVTSRAEGEMASPGRRRSGRRLCADHAQPDLGISHLFAASEDEAAGDDGGGGAEAGDLDRHRRAAELSRGGVDKAQISPYPERR